MAGCCQRIAFALLNRKKFQAQQLIPKPQNAIQPFRIDAAVHRASYGMDNWLMADRAACRVALEQSCKASHPRFDSRGIIRCLQQLLQMAELFTLV